MAIPVEPVTPAPLPPLETGPKNNTMSLVSLISGVVGILSSCVGPFVVTFFLPVLAIFCVGGGALLGVASLVTGIIGTSQVSKSAGAEKGKGMAITGIVLGAINIIIPCALVMLMPALAIILGPAIGDVFSQINSNLITP